MTPLEHALYYASRGWRVVPIPCGFKYPHGIDDWTIKATTDIERITRYWTANPGHGIGIAMGPATGLIAIDIDSYAGGDDGWAELEALHGPVPDTIEAITGGGGRHIILKHPDDGGPVITNAAHALPPGIDVRGDGGQIVVAPTIHPRTGQPYAWEAEHDPFDGVAPADAPPWLLGLLRTPAPDQKARENRVPYLGTDSIVERFAADHTWPELLNPAGWQFHSARIDHELWTRPGKEIREGASASLYYKGSDVLKIHTKLAPPLIHLATYTRFGFWTAMSFEGDHSAAAREYRLKINASTPAEKPISIATIAEPPPVDEMPEHIGQQPHSDLGNARRLITEHGADLRYAPQLGTWLAWDGHRWSEDVTGEAMRRAKGVIDGMVTQLATTHGEETRKKLMAHWMRSQAAGRLDAMVQLARTEPDVPVLVNQLDADPWIINTTGGVINLHTCTVHPAERRALVTKLAPVKHNPAALCPIWDRFLDWAMQSDLELVEFVQRAVGYSLTGLVTEQCLFFLHGSGENGKSTFLNVLGRLLGDYAIAAEPDLLLATAHEKHATGVADLVGRRLVVVQETEEGRRFAEATVKQLTGGDTIRARRMRQDFFEFHPTHKLWMAANHRPQVRGTDHAIWRRIRMIPFEAHLAPGQKDEHLLDKLLNELPGIFNWALAGCAMWATSGLQSPAAVVTATTEYRTEQDHVGRFIDDCCTLNNDVCVAARELRRAYETWCEENGERPWSAKAMAPQLVDRKCTRVQIGSQKEWTWLGLTLTDQPRPIPASIAMGRAMGRDLDDVDPEFGPLNLTRPIAPSNGPRLTDPLPGMTENAAHRGP